MLYLGYMKREEIDPIKRARKFCRENPLTARDTGFKELLDYTIYIKNRLNYLEGSPPLKLIKCNS